MKMKLTEDEIIKRDEICLDLIFEKLDDPNFKANYDLLASQKRQFVLSQLDDSTFNCIDKYDLTKVLCPNCSRNQFYHYVTTDENDTYAGIKCQACKYDYSFTH